MAYERQTWTCGETITADKLNHIEGGVENANPFVITVAPDDNEILVSDKTIEEISDAIQNKKVIVLNFTEDNEIFNQFTTYDVEIYQNAIEEIYFLGIVREGNANGRILKSIKIADEEVVVTNITLAYA